MGTVLRKAVHAAANLLFFSLTAAAAALLVLRLAGIGAYAVKTPSMAPACPVGTMIFVVRADFDEFAEGDIVTFRRSGTVVTHRVYAVDREARLLITKGDHNDIPDGVLVAEEEIVGKVQWLVPYAGFVYLLSETTAGKIAIVSVFVLLAFTALVTGKKEDAPVENQPPGEDAPPD